MHQLVEYLDDSGEAIYYHIRLFEQAELGEELEQKQKKMGEGSSSMLYAMRLIPNFVFTGPTPILVTKWK